MNQILAALQQLVNEAYPNLPVLSSYGKWLAGSFDPPCVFVYADHAGEKANTLTSHRKLYSGLIVLHFPRDSTSGEYQPIATDSLTDILRRERFMYPALVNGKKVVLTIDSEKFLMRLNGRGDRIYVTFPIETVAKIPVSEAPPIQNFQLESGGSQ
ncbi:hypothetical protein [Brevibacillus sp. SYSU BS000544]|uniref:hypothetical protein n=1 Tax=Brevibacillus sp. SYSU BS000544 TaxID=3416443 RepID=UPI003CE47322